MENFRKKMERFFLRNRNKGIPNLMMYIGIANVAVYLLSIIDPSNVVYALLFGLAVRPLLRKKWLGGLIAMVAAAACKFLALYVVLVRLVAPSVVPAAKLTTVTAAFTWPQLATACIGGVIACLIAPVVNKALDAKKS